MTWQLMDTAPHVRNILVRRDNGRNFEYYVVWWSGLDANSPWEAGYNQYPENRFDEWHEIPE